MRPKRKDFATATTTTTGLALRYLQWNTMCNISLEDDDDDFLYLHSRAPFLHTTHTTYYVRLQTEKEDVGESHFALQSFFPDIL